MPYVTPSQITEAKKMDLLTYLTNFNPSELVKISSNTYTTKTHNSIKICNGLWHWWSRDIGGRSALDYLIKVEEMSFTEAVNLINEQTIGKEVIPISIHIATKEFVLPLPFTNNDIVIKYLCKQRYLDKQIVMECINQKILYESKQYHNAVFVGLDQSGTPRYANIRGTTKERYHGEVPGSKKSFSFSLLTNMDNHKIHIFESAIDALSFATILKMNRQDYRKENYLSVAGVYMKKDENVPYSPPVALVQFLHDHPSIKTIVTHFDNDDVGVYATKQVEELFKERFAVINAPPKNAKDFNEQLVNRICKARTKER